MLVGLNYIAHDLQPQQRMCYIWHRVITTLDPIFCLFCILCLVMMFRLYSNKKKQMVNKCLIMPILCTWLAAASQRRIRNSYPIYLTISLYNLFVTIYKLALNIFRTITNMKTEFNLIIITLAQPHTTCYFL